MASCDSPSTRSRCLRFWYRSIKRRWRERSWNAPTPGFLARKPIPTHPSKSIRRARPRPPRRRAGCWRRPFRRWWLSSPWTTITASQPQPAETARVTPVESLWEDSPDSACLGVAAARASATAGSALGMWGLAVSIYDTILSAGHEVEFRKDSSLVVRFGVRPAAQTAPGPETADHITDRWGGLGGWDLLRFALGILVFSIDCLEKWVWPSSAEASGAAPNP